MDKRRSYRYWLLGVLLIGYAMTILLLKRAGYLDHYLLNAGYSYYDLRLNPGDQVQWSGKDFFDESWQKALNIPQGLYWVRAKLEIETPVGPFKKMGIKIWLRGAYDLHWDGVLIGRNGVVGQDKAGEVAGRYQEIFIVPDSLATPGVHQVALRVSNHYDLRMQPPRIMTGEYLSLSRDPLILTLFVHLLAGFFLLASIYYYALLMIGPDRQGTFVILGSLCLFLFALTLLEYLKYYYQYPYSFQPVRLQIIGYLNFGVAFLLPLLTLYQFRRPRKSWIMAGVFSLLAGVFHIVSEPDEQVYFMIFVGVTSAMGIALWAHAQGIAGTKITALGLLACTGCFWLYYEFNFFLGFGALVTVYLVALAWQRREEKALYEASLLKASRLEIELLKKKIQPHFLMNTLTSLINVVEESPREAVEFIHALAELFDILNDISSRATIPVQKEIGLCRAYLQVMSYRKDTEYCLEVIGNYGPEVLPPAILLTILENGLSHNRARNGRMGFTIEFCPSDLGKTYHVVSSGQLRKKQEATREGIGHQYIKARLQECYGDRWRFQSQRGTNGWETSFTIFQHHEHTHY